MPGIGIQLLGAFEVRRGGRPIEVPGRKVQALLARLARWPGEEVPRATLAALLWPDRGEEQARGSLRQALATLRRALGEGATRGADAVALGRSFEVDVAAFEAARPPDPLAFSGPFLEGFPPVAEPFDDWVHAERAALAARALEAFRAALDARVAAGAVDDGLALAERALALDPAFEPAYRARMRLLAARGERAAALREYARCAEAVERAVGAAPGPQTEALRRELLSAPAARARAGGDAGGAPVLAVLPFEILSDERGPQLFARGLEEDVHVELSRFRSLRVLPREAVARVAGAGADGAARALGADFALLAAVRAGGGRLRVSARLLDAGTGRQVWAERLDGDLADVLGVQDRITRAVVAALALRIDGEALARARRAPAERDVYGLWLEGMDLVRRGTREADLEARRLFERALALDPASARAHGGLSLSYFNDWSCAAWERWDENEQAAFRHAAQAARLDDRDHVVQYILGRILLYRREFERAEAHLRRALALNPNDADALAQIALGLAYLGEHEDGLAAAEAALRLNPAHPDWYLPCLAANHLAARRAREAIVLLERAPDSHVDTRAFLAAAWADLGEVARARDHAARFLARFAERIAPGGSPGDAIRWVLLVNPFRRAEDRAWLVDALGRAGLAAGGSVAGAGAGSAGRG